MLLDECEYPESGLWQTEIDFRLQELSLLQE
jgi:hypothetical protein